jgi:hypothetical protein
VCEFHILDVDKGMLYDLDTASLIPGKVKYAALSYTWGNETAPRAVEINRRVIPTRRNLWEFIDRVRVDTLLGNQEYYWIDALCIDQSTVGERNHQVSLMGKIYAQARWVIVWVGKLSANCEKALKKSRVSSPLYDTSRPFLAYTEDVEDLNELLQAPYWTRAWIVQEFVLAKRILVFYGQTHMEEKDLIRLLKSTNSGHLRQELRSPLAMEIAMSREEWHNRASRQSPFRAMHAWSTADDPSNEEDSSNELWFDGGEISQLLGRFGNNLQCTDPRDRVYSLLSLLSDKAKRCLAISPDYSKSSVELFETVLKSFEPIQPSEKIEQLSKMVVVVQRMLGLLKDDRAQRRARETRGRIEAAALMFEEQQAQSFQEFVHWD